MSLESALKCSARAAVQLPSRLVNVEGRSSTTTGAEKSHKRTTAELHFDLLLVLSARTAAAQFLPFPKPASALSETDVDWEPEQTISVSDSAQVQPTTGSLNRPTLSVTQPHNTHKRLRNIHQPIPTH